MTLTGNSCLAPSRRSLIDAQIVSSWSKISPCASVPVLQQAVERADDADADPIVEQRNVPEPGVGFVGMHDEGCALVDPLVPPAPFEVSVDRRLLQRRLHFADPQPPGDESALTCGVHRNRGAEATLRAIRHLYHHAGSAAPNCARASRFIITRDVTLEQHIEHHGALDHLDAVVSGVVEHHLVKLAAQHLPRHRALVWVRVAKVEGRRGFAGTTVELDAVFLRKGTFSQPVQHAQPLEGPVGARHERLADLELGRLLPFEKNDLVASRRDQG